MALSNEELEVMVRRLDDALTFVMTSIRQRVQLGSGLAGPDGAPLPGVVQEVTMLDSYRARLAQLAQAQAMADAAKNPDAGVDSPIVVAES